MLDLLTKLDRRDDLQYPGDNGPGGNQINERKGSNRRPEERDQAGDDSYQSRENQDSPAFVRLSGICSSQQVERSVNERVNAEENHKSSYGNGRPKESHY